MKPRELLQHPVWKSSWFVLGLIMIGFGIAGFIHHAETEVPAANELKAVKGKFNTLEAWTGRVGGTAYLLYLTVNGENKRFNVNRCRSLLKSGDNRTLERQLKPGDVVTVYFEDPNPVSIVDGSIWQILKNGEAACAYHDVVEYQKRADKAGFSIISPFILITGSLMVVVGIFKTKRRRERGVRY